MAKTRRILIFLLIVGMLMGELCACQPKTPEPSEQTSPAETEPVSEEPSQGSETAPSSEEPGSSEQPEDPSSEEPSSEEPGETSEPSESETPSESPSESHVHTGGTATCTHRAVCTECGEEYGELDPDHHNWEETPTVDTPASCTEEGEQSVHCRDCGARKDIQPIECIPHSFTNYEYNNDASETQTGTKTASCDYGCGTTDTVLDPDHPMIGHTHSGGTATCSSQAVCEVCGLPYGPIDPDAHVWENHKTVDKAPTCQEKGERSVHCSLCDARKDIETLNEVSHKFTTYIYNEDATEENAGTMTASCDYGCGATDTKPDPNHPQLEHVHYGGTATCSSLAVCEKCGEEYGSYNTNVHTWEENFTVDIEPTCVAAGEKSIHCHYCSAKKDVTSIDPLGHDFGAYVYNQDANCQHAGTKTATCQRNGCGATDTVADPSHPQTDHVFHNGYCDYCGADDPNYDFGSNVYENINYSGIYVPTEAALFSGLVFDWDPENLTMNFSESAARIVRKNNVKSGVKAAIAGTELANEDRLLVLEGNGIQGQFGLRGFVFKTGYRYAITFTYFSRTTPTNSYLIAYDSTPGNRTVVGPVLFEQGLHTITIIYEVRKDPNNQVEQGLTFYTTGELDVYIGKMKVECASSGGPTMTEMEREEGYTWPISSVVIGGTSSQLLSTVTDNTVKNAFHQQGFEDSQPVLHLTEGGDLAGFDRQFIYTPGYKYLVRMKYYSKGNGGYLIAMDGTYGNHAFAAGCFKSGYHEEVYRWTVGENGEYALTFYSIPEVYIIELNFTRVIDSPEDLAVQVDPAQVKTASNAGLPSGITFTLKENNAPALSGGTYMKISEMAGTEAYGALASIMTPANGFGDYVYHVYNSGMAFDCLDGFVINGVAYTLTMVVYAPEELMPPHLLPWANGAQKGTHSNWSASVIDQSKRLYRMTTTITPDASPDTFFAWSPGSVDYYVASISVQAPISYTEPEPSEEPPEFNYVPAQDPDVGAYQIQNMSTFIQTIRGTIYTSNVGCSQDIGVTNPENVGIIESEYNDVLYPVPANSQFVKIYNAQDYGIRPENSGETNSQNLNFLVKEIRAVSGLKRLYFKEGTYKFSATLTFVGVEDLYISSETADTRFTIQMTQWVQGVQITNCRNIHFNNYNFEYQYPTVVTGTVVSCNTSSKQIVIQIDDEYDMSQPCYNGGVIQGRGSYVEYKYDASLGKYIPNPSGNLLYIGNGLSANGSYNASNKQLTARFTSMSSVSAGTKVSYALTMYEYFGFYATTCEDVYLEGVNLYQTGGMAIGASYCHNIYIDHLNLSPKPGSAGLMTATADGFHPVMTTGEIRVTNSIFELSHDDSMNVKCAYQTAVSNLPKQIYYNPNTDILVRPGDVLDIYRVSDFHSFGSYTVVSVDTVNRCYYVAERITDDISGCYIANGTNCASLYIHNCFFGNKRNRGMLLQTRNMEVSNCTFMNIIHGPIQVESVGDSFTEGIMPRDVVIRNNKFINNYCEDVHVFTWGTSGATTPGSIKNVEIYNNIFVSSHSYPISFRGAGDSSAHNNLLYQTASDINIVYSSNVTTSNNRRIN